MAQQVRVSPAFVENQVQFPEPSADSSQLLVTPVPGDLMPSSVVSEGTSMNVNIHTNT